MTALLGSRSIYFFKIAFLFHVISAIRLLWIFRYLAISFPIFWALRACSNNFLSRCSRMRYQNSPIGLSHLISYQSPPLPLSETDRLQSIKLPRGPRCLLPQQKIWRLASKHENSITIILYLKYVHTNIKFSISPTFTLSLEVGISRPQNQHSI